MNSAIKARADGRYDIDFHEFWQKRQPWYSPRRWLPVSGLRLDPRMLAQVCVGVLDQTHAQDAEGNLLIGDDWTLELSPEDHRALEPYAARSLPAIQHGLIEAAKKRGAEIAHLDLRLELNPMLAVGEGLFIVESEAAGGAMATDRRARRPDPQDPDSLPTSRDFRSLAERMARPKTVRRRPKESRTVALLRCGTDVIAELNEGVRYTLGRRGGAGSNFIQLPTDSAELSRRHVRIEVVRGQVLVERLEGNPVAVGTTQLDAAEEVSMPLLGVVDISLTNGELELSVVAS